MVEIVGTTKWCLPGVDFPSDWHITHSRSNESTMKAYVETILLPYINGKRTELKLHPDYPALAIFDTFTSQGTKTFVKTITYT